MDWTGRVVLVTGANSGIGYKVVEHLLGLDMVVVGLDKNVDNIKVGTLSSHVLTSQGILSG